MQISSIDVFFRHIFQNYVGQGEFPNLDLMEFYAFLQISDLLLLAE